MHQDGFLLTPIVKMDMAIEIAGVGMKNKTVAFSDG
jgi:hypothetical protein